MAVYLNCYCLPRCLPISLPRCLSISLPLSALFLCLSRSHKISILFHKQRSYLIVSSRRHTSCTAPSFPIPSRWSSLHILQDVVVWWRELLYYLVVVAFLLTNEIKIYNKAYIDATHCSSVMYNKQVSYQYCYHHFMIHWWTTDRHFVCQ